MRFQGIDKKVKYEYLFIICTGIYALFTVFDLLFFGKDAVQWEILLGGNDFIADFTNVIGYASNRNPYDSTMVFGLHERAYPPLQYVLSYFLSTSVPNMQDYYEIGDFTILYMNTKIALLYVFYAAFSVIGFFELVRRYKNGSNLIKTLTALFLTLSFPIILAIERGNSILPVMVFVFVFLCFYDHDNRALREMAFIALALAAALKIAPAFLGILLIMDKRWKEAIRTVVYGLLLFFLPFLFFEGGFANVPLFFRNLSLQTTEYARSPDCTLKGFVINFYADFAFENLDTLTVVCTVLTILFCVLMFVAAFLTNRKSDRLLYLSLIMLLLPSHTESYCIAFLIPALIAFLNESEKKHADLYIILGGCLCMCSLGGILGRLVFNYHNGLLVLIICAVIKSVEVIVKRLVMKNKSAELIY